MIARRQARALGATSEHLRRRVESPDWEALTVCVLRLVGAQRTFRQRAMAATLDAGAGAAVSHESAAALWRLPGFAAGPMHVSRVTGRSTLATVHRLLVEVDSDLHHSSLLDEAADTRRDAALAGAGYAVVRIKEHDLWHRPDEVVRRLLAS